MTAILLLPVKEFFNIRVNFDDRQGIYLSESFIASSDMTFPNADKEVLMNLAYFKRRSLNNYKKYVELVFLTLSEPARSIKDKVEETY